MKFSLCILVLIPVLSGCGQYFSSGSATPANPVQRQLAGSWSFPDSTKGTDKISVISNTITLETQEGASVENPDGTYTEASFCDIRSSSNDFKVEKVADIASSVHLSDMPANEPYVIIARNVQIELVNNPDNSKECQSIVETERKGATTGPMYLTFGFDSRGRLIQSGRTFEKNQ